MSKIPHAAGLPPRLVIVPRLGVADAPRLTPLIADYAATLLEQDVAAMDAGYAQRLIEDPAAEIAGAELDGRLVGFALYYDLPEAISRRRAGQLDDLYVDPSARGAGVGRALIDHVAGEGARRGWIHLRWMAPDASAAIPLYDRLAERAPWRNYVIRLDRRFAW
jgi:GNAT superfamily N-acetyltransferase